MFVFMPKTTLIALSHLCTVWRRQGNRTHEQVQELSRRGSGATFDEASIPKMRESVFLRHDVRAVYNDLAKDLGFSCGI